MADQAGLNSPRSPPTQPTQPPQLLDLDGIAKELEAVNERRVASAQAQAIIDQNQAADRQSYAYITGQLAQGFNVSVPVPNSPPHDMSAIKDVETNSEFTRLASRVGALSAKVDNLVPRFQAADTNTIARIMNATLDGNPHENIHPLKSTSNQEIPGFPETIRELERISKPDIDRFLYALGFTLDDNDFEYKWMNLRRIIGIIKPGADDC